MGKSVQNRSKTGPIGEMQSGRNWFLGHASPRGLRSESANRGLDFLLWPPGHSTRPRRNRRSAEGQVRESRGVRRQQADKAVYASGTGVQNTIKTLCHSPRGFPTGQPPQPGGACGQGADPMLWWPIGRGPATRTRRLHRCRPKAKSFWGHGVQVEPYFSLNHLR